ncbi:putative transporter [Ferrimonas senticii]|uniref:putative transporter n=1 Tax=Ferrimonas senticii TaxID=394566 RepID=UPI000410D9D9|nr:putative transporter [Ferrimonas senticii]
MFRSFFLDRRWQLWSVLGTALILFTTWYMVQVDVQLTQWFGEFYDLIQNAIANPGTITEVEFMLHLLTFFKVVAVYVVVMVGLDFFVRHYVFNWRTAMHEYYCQHWDKLHHIEGAAQRVQEDTMLFAKNMELLGVQALRSLMTLIAFSPVLWELSKNINQVPFIGHVPHALVFLAIFSAVFGTVLLAVVGIKLPGLEFNNQKAEAALRKELVLGEDSDEHAKPPTLQQLFKNVRANYVVMYRHYLYFDLTKHSYLQVTNLLPYIVMSPAIVSGAITLGVMKQITRSFERVEGSLQYLVFSWPRIVELISIYKRLRAFEDQIKPNQDDPQLAPSAVRQPEPQLTAAE